MNKYLAKYASEAIAHQDPSLFNEISLVISEVKCENNYNKNCLQRTRLPAYVLKRLGLNVTFECYESDVPNAVASLPNLDPNHKLISIYRKAQWPKNAPSKIQENVEKLKTRTGTVDRKKSRVDGVFSEVEYKIYTASSVLKDLSSGEAAAIIIHELGHCFTVLEQLSASLYTNFALKGLVAGFLNTEIEKERIQLILDFEKATGVTVEDKDNTATVKSADMIVPLVIKDIIESTRNEFGTPIFDIRGCEFMADQFASRHGAGKDLVTALAKMSSFDRSARSTTFFLLVEVMKFFLYVPGGLLLTIGSDDPVDTFSALFLVNPFVNEYDTLELRMEKIRRELQSALMDKEIPAERQAEILSDLKVIEAAMSKFTDRESLWQKIYILIAPGTRKERRTYKLQLELEKLAANNLYARAAEFKQLQNA